jgi:hypothetical protein
MLAMTLATAIASAPPTPGSQASAAAAVMVVKRYYGAINRRDYASAHAIWSGGHSLAQLRRGYSTTRSVKLEPLPPFETEGAAGSIYTEIRVRLDAVLTNGRHQRYAGSYVLRRVNDVDGSTAEQRRWHIVSAHLKLLG